MSTAAVSRRLLNDALTDMLATESGFQVGLVRTPEDVVLDPEGLLTEPYAIVYPQQNFVFRGDLAAPQRHSSLPYYVTNVGRTAEQAQWMSDRTQELILARSASGAFANPITASDVDVIDRCCTMQGGPESAGGGLWQVVDRYDLEVVSV